MKKNHLINILKNWKNPFYLRNVFIFKLFSIIYRRNNGAFIFDEDWDNLIILDACRYDIFEKEFRKRGMIGTLQEKKSRGSHTISFLLENFRKDRYDDIIYITANPYVNKVLKNKFFKIISPWKDQWDEVFHTVLPQTMYDLTIETALKYPNKKLIIHFMQPHFPYIDSKYSHINIRDLSKSIYNTNSTSKIKKKNSLLVIYCAKFYTTASRTTQINAYKKNLELVLNHVEKLINFLPGITVISSDHGEAFGEIIHPLLPIRYFGHHRRIKMPILLKIPWLRIKPEEKDFQYQKEIKEKQKIKKALENFNINNSI